MFMSVYLPQNTRVCQRRKKNPQAIVLNRVEGRFAV